MTADMVTWNILLHTRFTLSQMTSFPSWGWYAEQWRMLGDLFVELDNADANAALCWQKAREYDARSIIPVSVPLVTTRKPLADRDELPLGEHRWTPSGIIP